MNHDHYLNKAKELACLSVNKQQDLVNYSPSDFYVVWFAKTLQNWKALVSTDVKNGLYFEITHNGDKGETYIDTYTKISNEVVID